jgi:hypothetical protein
MRIQIVFGLMVGMATATWSQQAWATFHLWKIDQVYSNAGGSVQYVDFVLPSAGDDEQFLSGHQLKAGLNNNTLTFGTDLPAVPVAGQHFLVATPGFAAISGVIPDYTLPVAPFFNASGDTLNYAFVDSFTFGALPTDGVHALNRDNSTSINAPTNFAGQVGFVPEPSSLALASIAIAAVLACAVQRGRAWRK